MSQSDFTIDSKCTAETKQFMTSVLEALKSSDAFKPCDRGSLRMLMVSYDMYVRASNELLKDGAIITDKHGKKMVHPAVNVTKSYWNQVSTFMREFGLTLRSRERIKSLTPDVDDDNELNKYITKK